MDFPKERCVFGDLSLVAQKFFSLKIFMSKFHFVLYSGLHHKKSCSKDTLNKIKAIIEQNKDYLYVDRIETYERSSSINLKPNGGWGDSRDQGLCMRYVNGNEPL